MKMKTVYYVLLQLCFMCSYWLNASSQSETRKSRVDPPLCRKAPAWTVENGLDLMAEGRGKITFIALMEVHCEFCHRQINGIKNLRKTFEEVDMDDQEYYIIVPRNESASWVQYWKRALEEEGIGVFVDSVEEPVWTALNGHNHDFYIYDRCGRLLYFIPHPQSNLYYHYTISSMFAALHYQHVGCGYCRFDTASRSPSKEADLRRKLAKLRPPVRKKAEWSAVTASDPSISHTNFPNSAYGSQHDRDAYSNLPGPGDSRHEISVSVVSNSYTDPYNPQSESKPKKNQKAPEVELPETSEATTTEQPAVFVDKTEVNIENVGNEQLATPTENSEKQNVEGIKEEIIVPMKAKNIDTESIPEPEKWAGGKEPEEELAKEPIDRDLGKDMIFGGEDYELEETDYIYPYDDLDFPNSESASDTDKKAVTEQDTAQAPPTEDPEKQQNTATKPADQSQPITKKPRFVGGASCAEFTDEVCLEQQIDIGMDKRHPCCYKGIYLTGKCNTDLCSDKTYNVCCFQKFIQARYLCCHNSTMSGKKIDEFSHCCYDNFVFLDHDDPCCPSAVAKEYWSEKTALYELCLPNVDIDFREMVLDTKFKDDSVLQLRLGEYDVLQYSCPYKTLRDSFFYWQPQNSTASTKNKQQTENGE